MLLVKRVLKLETIHLRRFHQMLELFKRVMEEAACSRAQAEQLSKAMAYFKLASGHRARPARAEAASRAESRRQSGRAPIFETEFVQFEG